MSDGISLIFLKLLIEDISLIMGFAVAALFIFYILSIFSFSAEGIFKLVNLALSSIYISLDELALLAFP